MAQGGRESGQSIGPEIQHRHSQVPQKLTPISKRGKIDEFSQRAAPRVLERVDW